jgi:ribosomal protein S18 acetylase RimI-like enzyme
MVIREAVPSDLEGLVELWIELMDYHRERDPFFRRSVDGHTRFRDFVVTKMEAEEAILLVAEQHGTLVGFSMAMVRDYPPVFETIRHGFIQDAVVTERARRQGVGRRLYEETLAWLREQGVSRIELEVATSNPVSQAFWYAMGFRDSIKRLALDLEQ